MARPADPARGGLPSVGVTDVGAEPLTDPLGTPRRPLGVGTGLTAGSGRDPVSCPAAAALLTPIGAAVCDCCLVPALSGEAVDDTDRSRRV